MAPHPLNWLFVDMNSYFASAEQQMSPELRGLPVAVVPVMADSTCCIAASYEAKKYGVSTGTKVAEARKLCPALRIVESRPELYIDMHKEIRAAVESVLPVEKVWSIDEMSCRLTGRQRGYDNAAAIGLEVKRAIRGRVGEYLKCSVGIAPNRFLAKVASDMRKPDGFTVIRKEELPDRLYDLSLTDLPGIGRRMNVRLRGKGIRTVKDLCGLSEEKLARIWESVVGRRWYGMLRGEDVTEPETGRKTVSHSHVLPPGLRTDEGTRAVFVRLIHKAAFRLRRLEFLARRMIIRIDYLGGGASWKKGIDIHMKNDTRTMIEAFSGVWEERPRTRRPLRASIVFTELVPVSQSTLPLLSGERKQDKVATALDRINVKYGSNLIYYGSMHEASEAAPMRIAFSSIPDTVAEGNKAKSNPRRPGK